MKRHRQDRPAVSELTYAIADLHGSFDLLQLALSAARQHASLCGRRTIVFLGDYIDRGPQSREIIETLIAGPPEGWLWRILKGNHEDMMVGAFKGNIDIALWLDNGGDATLASYGIDGARSSLKTDVLATHLAWLDRLPLLHVDRHRLFVHAGVDRALPLDRQLPRTLLWTRDDPPTAYDGRHVVHGHIPHIRGPVLGPGRTNLDTLAWRTGRVVIAVFDDERKGAPIELIEVTRPHHGPA
jgi:serine/threonine protein phosphatase 1